MVGLGLCADVLAAPPVSRPSPPPCCADGQCIANPLTSGYYPVRWRRWPLEYAEPVATGAEAPVSEQIKRDVQPFERPSPEHEDQKAPEPSVPRTEQDTSGVRPLGRPPFGPGGGGAGGAAPTTTQPPTGPGLPTRTLPPYPGTGTTPQTGPLGLPGGPSQPAGGSLVPQTTPLVPPGGAPAQPGATPPQRPLVPPNSLLNRSGPTGDVDPPPSLPLDAQPIKPSEPAGKANQASMQPAQQPMSEEGQSPSNDPPPAPPSSLLSAAE